MTKAGYVIAAALMLGGCFSAAAQNAPGQEPPPVADNGATVQAKCIDENDGYARRQAEVRHPAREQMRAAA